jgi:predicted Zn finger-like uncharacterized protein
VFVTCGNCDAEYELDDAKIPAGGARLRCTNCKHSFVVTPPEASDLRSTDDLAHDALTAAAQRRNDPDSERAAAPEEEDSDSDGEADWQFNEEVASPKPEARPSASGFSLDMLEPPPDSPESPFDHQGDDWSELSLAEEVVDDLLAPGGPVATDAAAAVDDLLGDIDNSQWGESDRDLRSDLNAPSEVPDVGDAPDPDGSGESSATTASDSFDDLSDWNLFDPTAETGGSAPSSGSRDRPSAAALDGVRAEPQVKIAVAMDRPASVVARWTDRVSAVAGWTAVSALIVVSLVAGLAPHSSDARVRAGSWSGAGFEADQIVGRWVDNAVAGSIYVVSGRVRRTSGSDRTSQTALGIRLIDTKGREIDRPPIPLAPAVPERILRESSPAELDAFQQRRADRIAAAGDRWISFEAVLTDLPGTAGRFELQALDR